MKPHTICSAHLVLSAKQSAFVPHPLCRTKYIYIDRATKGSKGLDPCSICNNLMLESHAYMHLYLHLLVSFLSPGIFSHSITINIRLAADSNVMRWG